MNAASSGFKTDIHNSAPPSKKRRSHSGGPRSMHIAFVASECVPFSKTGGLADVVGALPRALLEASKILGVPHIFHCHDWQTALVPVLLGTVYAEDPAFRDVGTVFTIHNMGYQGLFPPDILPLLMLPWDLFTMSKMEFFGQVNFLKGALTYSDYVTTVSRKYSQEIQTTEYGFGLEGVLRDRASTVSGILNGVDYDEWSPQTDKFTVAKFSPEDLSGKAKCKQDLLATFGVTNADSKSPVIGIVSRFAAQKGFDLIAQIMDRLAGEDMIIVALGTGDKEYEEMFLRMQKQVTQTIAVKIAYDNAIAHKIEAGAD